MGLLLKLVSALRFCLKLDQKNALDVKPNARFFSVVMVFIIETDCVLCDVRTETKTNKTAITETVYVICGISAEAAETVEY